MLFVLECLAIETQKFRLVLTQNSEIIAGGCDFLLVVRSISVYLISRLKRAQEIYIYYVAHIVTYFTSFHTSYFEFIITSEFSLGKKN